MTARPKSRPEQAPPEGQRQVVGEFRKNDRGELIRAALSSYRGETYCDVRTWWTNDAGELCPTRKGLTMHVESFGELEQLIAALRRALEVRGLAGPAT
jgi:hypothetical protein